MNDGPDSKLAVSIDDFLAEAVGADLVEAFRRSPHAYGFFARINPISIGVPESRAALILDIREACAGMVPYVHALPPPKPPPPDWPPGYDWVRARKKAERARAKERRRLAELQSEAGAGKPREET